VKKQGKTEQPEQEKNSMGKTLGSVGTMIGVAVCSGALLMAPALTSAAETKPIPKKAPAENVKVKTDAKSGQKSQVHYVDWNQAKSSKPRDAKTSAETKSNSAVKVKSGAK